MRRTLCALLAVGLLLGACSAAQPSQTTADTGKSAELGFLISNDADPLFREAAEMFSRKTAELTGGELRVRVRSSDDPAGDFSLGNGDLFFADSRAEKAFSESLSLLGEPMLYSGYLPFTMALNSARMLELLTEELRQGHNAVPLAAYYQGSDFMLTTRQSSGDIDLISSENSEGGEQPQTRVAAIRSESRMRDMLTHYGLEVVSDYDAQDRLYGVYTGSIALAEFSIGELDALEWYGSDVTLVSISHSASPRWLLVAADAAEGLSEQQYAALQEAACYLFPVIDGGFRQRESDVVSRCREAGISVKYSFPALREEAAMYWHEYALTDLRTKYMLGILSNME